VATSVTVRAAKRVAASHAGRLAQTVCFRSARRRRNSHYNFSPIPNP